VNRARQALAVAALVAVTAGCRGRPVASQAPAGDSGVQELIRAHKYDEAIARVGEGADAESLYLLGLAWAGKAESAPIPTPAGTAGSGEVWKPEELRALELLQRAVAARPDHAGAHRAIAELLAPHALERLRSGRPAAHPAAPAADGPDASVERVLRAYGDAVQADPAATEAAADLVRFATAAGRLAEADAAYRELLRRQREDPGLLVRYGDFLAGPMGQPDAALAQYAQALMWRPDDAATRVKVAEIHLQAAAGCLQRHEYLPAEARLKEARRAGVDPSSPQTARLRELEQVLRDIRGR
jgi:tetratricopeptide (TPR) repeat protein